MILARPLAPAQRLRAHGAGDYCPPLAPAQRLRQQWCTGQKIFALRWHLRNGCERTAGDSCPPLAPAQRLRQQRTGQGILVRRWHLRNGCRSSGAFGRGFLPDRWHLHKGCERTGQEIRCQPAGTCATVAAAVVHGAGDFCLTAGTCATVASARGRRFLSAAGTCAMVAAAEVHGAEDSCQTAGTCATVAAAAVHGAGDSCPPLAPAQWLRQQRCTGQGILVRRWHLRNGGGSSGTRGRGFLSAAGNCAAVSSRQEILARPLAPAQRLRQQWCTGQEIRCQSAGTCATVAAAAVHGAEDSCPPLAPAQRLREQWGMGQRILARCWHLHKDCERTGQEILVRCWYSA